MKKRGLYEILCIFGILLLSLPSLNASIVIQSDTQMKNSETFRNCYLKASGEIDFTWQLMDIPLPFIGRYIAYWPIVFLEPNTEITIYSKKDGDIIWNDMMDSGQWTLYLVGFRGIYNNDGSTAENLIANLEGKAIFIIVTSEQDADEKCIKDEETIFKNEFSRYPNCYVEIIGLLSDEDYPKLFDMGPFWKICFLRLDGNGNPPSFVLYWYMRLDETAQIIIKNEKNGDLLWSNNDLCNHEIRMLRFNGDYLSSMKENGRIQKDISGTVQMIWIKELAN